MGLSLDHPLFRSYGVILPSSLTIVLSLTLGYSPCLPVSVLGTGTYIISLEAFLGNIASEDLRNPKISVTITLQIIRIRIYLYTILCA